MELKILMSYIRDIISVRDIMLWFSIVFLLQRLAHDNVFLKRGAEVNRKINFKNVS